MASFIDKKCDNLYCYKYTNYTIASIYIVIYCMYTYIYIYIAIYKGMCMYTNTMTVWNEYDSMEQVWRMGGVVLLKYVTYQRKRESKKEKVTTNKPA